MKPFFLIKQQYRFDGVHNASENTPYRKMDGIGEAANGIPIEILSGQRRPIVCGWRVPTSGRPWRIYHGALFRIHPKPWLSYHHHITSHKNYVSQQRKLCPFCEETMSTSFDSCDSPDSSSSSLMKVILKGQDEQIMIHIQKKCTSPLEIMIAAFTKSKWRSIDEI